MTHMHITAWVVALILFIVAYFKIKGGSQGKALHMVLRLFYLFIIGTGILLLTSISTINGEYIGKAIMGVLVIGFMEMILGGAKKGKSTKVLWIVFVIVFLLVVAMGLRMPLGFSPLA